MNGNDNYSSMVWLLLMSQRRKQKVTEKVMKGKLNRTWTTVG